MDRLVPLSAYRSNDRWPTPQEVEDAMLLDSLGSPARLLSVRVTVRLPGWPTMQHEGWRTT